MSLRLVSSIAFSFSLLAGAASAQTDMRAPGGAPTHQVIPAPPPAPTGAGVISPLKTLPPPPPAPAPQLLNQQHSAPVTQPAPAGGEWRRHFESPGRSRAPATQPNPAPVVAPAASPAGAAPQPPHAAQAVEARAPRAEASAPRAKPRRPHRPRRPLAPPAPEFYDGGFGEPPPLWRAPYDPVYVAPGPYYSEPRPGYYRRAPVIDEEGCVLRKKRVRVNGRWVKRWVRLCR